jgi:hypothetical protein
MKIKVDRLISIATLAVSVIALVLVLKRPQPVAPPQAPSDISVNAQSFNDKLERFQQAQAQGQSGAEVRLNAREITAAIAQAAGAAPATDGSSDLTGSRSASPTGAASSSAGSSSANGSLLSGDLGAGEPSIKDYQVNFEGDQVVGQFLTQVAGKDVWVTVKGHMGSKDGYATFEPTEFKVGDLNVPVSLVNDQLQKKLLEQRDRFKLPDSASNLKVENGEVVLSK